MKGCVPLLMVCLGLLSSQSGLADGGHSPAEGHSLYGEAFNEGPRQAAVLLEPEEVGRVQFPVSTSSTRAQQFFNQGVAQLHSFWFYEAERSFRQVLTLDANCGMAYWGLAMANRNNPKRAREFLDKVERVRERMTPKELRWVDAFRPFFAADGKPETKVRVALSEALEAMAFDFPEDLEVKVWVVLQAWENSSSGVAIGSREALDALLREVLAEQQWHPGAHHLRIHLWNSADDRRALKSAAVCGQTGPQVAHLWHMPGHTFSKLKRYEDAAWQQEAAARADHAWMLGQHLMPDEIHNYAHNNDWLVSNLVYVGRIREALALAKNMVELPQLAPRTEVIGNSRPGEDRSSFRYGSRQIVEVLRESELWAQLVELEGTPYLAEREDLEEEAARLSGLVMAYSETGRLPEALNRLELLEAVLPKVRQERFEAADKAESEGKKAGKAEVDVAKSVQEVLKTKLEKVDAVAAHLAAGRMSVALAKGEKDEAAVQLVEAKKLSLVQKSRVELLVGNIDAGLKTAREAVEKDGGQVLRLANLVEVLWKQGKQDEAVETFQKLRKLGASADLNLPVFGRLSEVREKAGVEGDWRQKGEVLKDIGVRPALESLGPFRWGPQSAPAWVLPADSGRFMRSEEWKEKNVLMMFYLGSGCIHCIEQLNQFAPFTEAYQKEGITLLAVSADSQAELHKTLEKAKNGGGFPFGIVADPTLETFKKYRAYDDFEQQALHGLFLIDGEGRVRWQNISYQPFNQPEWLLNEAKRLLALPRSSGG
ncbi:MAG: redoxin domain-containing protein [Verrucomicrobiota bacterium]